MTTRLRVTVAGAGVLGLTTALALADAGCSVVVVDPGGPNASSVAAGMIAPVLEAALDPVSRDNFDLLMAARDLWPALAARSGIVLDRTGAVAVGRDGWLEDVARRMAGLNERPAEIGEATIRGLAPGLSDAYERGLLTREDWRVDAPGALAALTAAAASAGVTFLPRTMRGRGEADVLVIATGAAEGMTDVAPELSSLSPIKGHIVRVAAQADGAVIRTEGLYAVPGGGMIFGATMEPGRADAAVDEARAGPLLAAGLKLFPGLAGAAYQISAGVRAATLDGLPLAGSSVAPGVMLATGARRNGWLLAPLVAQVVAAEVTGRDNGPFAARLAPARMMAERFGGTG
jgi:glycine oxidase